MICGANSSKMGRYTECHKNVARKKGGLCMAHAMISNTCDERADDGASSGELIVITVKV